jgi:hypothetical protein
MSVARRDEAPHVELFWWEGCPSWRRTIDELREVVMEAGLDPDRIEITEIRSEGAAENHRFPGSPTIRIDGVDIQPPSAQEPIGLTCRVYRLRDGRISPTPDPADVRDALLRARDSHRAADSPRASERR